MGLNAEAALLAGREAELAWVEERLRRAGCVLIVGDAGIGKSALWSAAIERCPGNVLELRAVEGEVDLPFAALAAILEPLADEFEQLPRVQERALAAALLRDEIPPAGVPSFAVAAATASVLRRAGPLLVAIDDAQWLDAPSARALAFALRRLRDIPVAVLATSRTGTPWSSRELEAALAEAGVERLELAALPLGALGALVRAELGLEVSPARLRALYRVSGGNPLYAKEIARESIRKESQEFDVPRSLLELLRDRVRAVSPPARRLLRIAAETSDPRIDRLQAQGFSVEDIGELLARDIVVEDVLRLRFTHPLLAAAVRADMSDLERREIHASLATTAEEPIERALHLGVVHVLPDERIAAELEAAANRAHERGATEVGAVLAEHALRLTPAEDERFWRRAHLAADMHLRLADVERPKQLLEDLVERCPQGPLRARALADITWLHESGRRRAQTLELTQEALDEPGLPPALRAEILIRRAVLLFHHGRFEESLATHDAAAISAREAGDAWLVAHAVIGRERMKYRLALPFDPEEIDRAVDAIDANGNREFRGGRHLPARVSRARLRIHEREYDGARDDLERLLQGAIENGDEATAIRAHADLARLALAQGNPSDAASHARIALESGRHLPAGTAASVGRFAAALVALHTGDVMDARRQIAAGVALDPPPEELVGFRSLEGGLELVCGNLDAALRLLDPLFDEGLAVGNVHPAYQHWVPDGVEALVAAGRITEAKTRLAPFEHMARELNHAWARSVASRCRALILAAGGAMTGAFATTGDALEQHKRFDQPLELGRTLLVQGTILRRAKRRRDARIALDEALQIFSGIGARLWVELAERELERVGGRRGERWQLTPTEDRIARLAAGGARNKEIASRLFVSEKTVEANLSRVYRKLEVRSRTELGARLPPSEA